MASGLSYRGSRAYNLRDVEGDTMTTRFAVEGLVPSRGVVVARKLEDNDFQLTPKTTLEGFPVKGFDIPRVIGAGGKLRKDIFGFFLADPLQVELFRVGAEIKLESG